jgi:hypothetical protein
MDFELPEESGGQLFRRHQMNYPKQLRAIGIHQGDLSLRRRPRMFLYRGSSPNFTCGEPSRITA